MAWLILALISTSLAVLALAAIRLSAIAKVIVLGQVVYWTISYVLRPLFLLWFQPNPPIRDGISDQRIAMGGYEAGVYEVGKPILFGLVVYTLMIVILSRFMARNSQSVGVGGSMRDRPQTSLFVLLLAFGWVARSASILGANQGLVLTLQILAVVGAGGILMIPGRPEIRHQNMLFLVAIVSEVLWSIISASKTPLIAAVMFVIIRFSISGWSKARVMLAGAAGAAIIAGFALFQQFKLGRPSSFGGSKNAIGFYPTWSEPLLPIVERFDQFSAVTDARLAGESTWLSGREIFLHALTAFVPQPLGGDKVSAGLLWNTEVRAYSLQNAQYSQVSLAEGFIAEGFVAGGYLGIFLEALWISIAVIAITTLVGQRGIFWRSLGIICLGFPILFERGFLGGIETFSKGLQVSVVVSLLWILFFASRIERKGPIPPSRTDPRSRMAKPMMKDGSVS
jgi:hypothetical protein